MCQRRPFELHPVEAMNSAIETELVPASQCEAPRTRTIMAAIMMKRNTSGCGPRFAATSLD
jgi:hypothetical protein